LAQGLVGAWNFWEGEGLAVYDASGNGNDGVGADASGWGGNPWGIAMEMDGAVQYVSIADALALDLTLGMTLVARVRMDSADPDPGVQIAMGLVTKHDNAGGWNGYNLHYWTTSHPNASFRTKFGAQLRDGADSDVDAGVTSAVHTAAGWYHVVATNDGTTIRIYVDGIEENSAAGSVIGNSAENLELGRDTWQSNNPWWGAMDHAYIYNRALFAAEVAELYHDSFAMFRERRRYWMLLGAAAYRMRRHNPRHYMPGHNPGVM